MGLMSNALKEGKGAEGLGPTRPDEEVADDIHRMGGGQEAESYMKDLDIKANWWLIHLKRTRGPG